MSAGSNTGDGGRIHAQEISAAARSLGVTVEGSSVGPGRLRMKIRKDMLNGHDVCHGGFIFTLATAAIESAGGPDETKMLASECSIEFLRPARRHDTLSAEVLQAGSTRRARIYDVRITNQDGDTVALVRGRAISSNGNKVG